MQSTQRSTSAAAVEGARAGLEPYARPSPRERRGTAWARRAPAEAPPEERLVTALGWLSIGIGVAQLIAPRAFGRAIGVPARPAVLRVFGLREIATGVGLLTQTRRSEWMWARVAGDGLDLAALAVGAAQPGARRGRVIAAGAAVAGVAALDMLAGTRCAEREESGEPGALAAPEFAEHSVAINRSAEECYRYWRDLKNLPRFMRNLKSVQELDERVSHWTASGPAGMSVEWDAEIVADTPGRSIGWRTLPDAQVEHSGTVNFEPAVGGRGSVVRVCVEYRLPGGKLGAAVAKLSGSGPGQEVKEDLRRFKQLLETGEIPTTVGQPAGRRSVMSRMLLRKGEAG